MKPMKQSLIVYWMVRYYSAKAKRVKRRVLFLNTESMPMDWRYTFMYRVEAENLLNSLELRSYKKFFVEIEADNHHEKHKADDATSTYYTLGGVNYFETESGDRLPEWELRIKMGKEGSATEVSKYLRRYFEYEEKTEIQFSPEEIRQLQIFTDDYDELKKNELEPPCLSFSLCSNFPSEFYHVLFKNTTTEHQAYVLKFRNMYSEDRQAGGSFPDLCNLIKKDHKNAALAVLAEDSLADFDELKSMDIRTVYEKKVIALGAPYVYQLLQHYPSMVTIDDFVQLFFYTQYHHHAREDRAEKLDELIRFLDRPDAEEILKYIFFAALWTFQILFFNTGQVFVSMLERNSPGSQNSTIIKNLGKKGSTTEELRKHKIFETHKCSFAHALWIEAQLPKCGSYYFEDEAERRMLIALGRDSI